MSDNPQITKNDYTIDYLSGVVPTPFVSRFFKSLAAVDRRLSFNRFQKWSTGINFYKERYCLNDQSYFIVGFNYRTLSEPIPEGYDDEIDHLLCTTRQGSNSGIFLSISGDGLRFLGDQSCKLLFKCLLGYQFKCTRIDLACDVYDPDNIYVPHLQEALSNVYYQRGFVPGEFSMTTNLSRAPGNLRKFTNADHLRDKELLRKIGVEASPGCFDTVNFTWGRKDSTKCQFRLYDKWLEVATSPRLKAVADQMLADIPTNYWYRFEYEMHKQYAFDIFNSLASDEVSVPAAFAECAEDCFFPVLCGFGKTVDMCAQQHSDIWEDFIELASFYGAGEVVRTIHFV